jgi:hypothetical protein
MSKFKTKKKEEEFVKQYKDKTGYLYVILYKNNKGTKHYVHELVAQTFIPNPDNKSKVRHIDGNITNNCADNLEWY